MAFPFRLLRRRLDAGARAGTLALAVLLASPSEAQSGICDRSQDVREAILALIPGEADCSAVTAAQLSGIRHLDLSFHRITSLRADDFEGLTGLRNLNLGQNELKSIPEGLFDPLAELNRLNLSWNGMRDLPLGAFHTLTALTHLHLSYNQLRSLSDGMFDSQAELIYLDLDHTHLRSLAPDTFEPIFKLEHLSLGQNKLTTLPSGLFDPLAELSWLNLTNNYLERLPADIFKPLLKLDFLGLNGNPGSPFLPTADAGEDQTVDLGALVTLHGTASDPWGQAPTYSWTQIAGETVSLNGRFEAQPQFTAPASQTTLTFRLTLRFERNPQRSWLLSTSSKDEVTVRVGPVLPPPDPDPQPPGEACEPDEKTLCLHGNRYQVHVQWWRSEGSRRAGTVAPESTDQSGVFWFFDQRNWEILINVLDGCSTNDKVWVFGASTTDLGYLVSVTDTVTGSVRKYHNEAGTPAPAITDTAAFPEGCHRE